MRAITNDEIGREPKDWEFQGSVDGQTWVTLDTRADVDDWVSSETKTFELDSPATYQYFRFDITANNGDQQWTGFDGFQLYTRETISEDEQEIFLDVLANDIDVDGDTLTIDSIGDVVATDGTVMGTAEIVNVDGVDQIRFVPNEVAQDLAVGEVAEMSIQYTVSDGQGGTDTATVKFAVEGSNDGVQISGNISATTDEDTSFTMTQEQLLANASDIDGDALTATNLQGDNVSIFDNGDGTFTVTPDANFYGDLNLTFDVTDGNGSTVQAGLDVTVNAVNDGPVANDDGNVGSLVLDGNSSLTLGVGNNDVTGQVTSMWFKVDADVTGPQGLFNVGSSANNGVDRSLYLDDNGNLNSTVWGAASGTEVVTTNVGDLSDGEWHHIVFNLGNGQTQLYVDGELAATGNFGSSAFNWSNEMTIGESGHGNASLLNGEIRDFQTYTNFATNQDGVDALMRGDTLEALHGAEPQFRMQFEEGSEFLVEGSNAHMIGGAPVISGNPQVVQSLEGKVFAADDVVTNFDVLANDFDIEGDALSITGLSNVVDADGNILGTVNVVEIDGIQQVQFLPNPDAIALPAGESVTGQFTYTVSDEHGATDTASVAFKYVGTNNAPEVSQNLAAEVAEDGSITLTQADLLANATDLDGDDLIASNLALNGNGTVTDNGDGTFTVTPDADFNGSIDISFDISDGAATISGGLDLTVTAVNDLPITTQVSATTAEDTAITVTQEQLLANANDIDGGPLSVANLRTEDAAIVTDNGDGTFTIQPSPDFNGTLNLSYDISDGFEVIEGALALNVTAVNDAAVAGDVDVSGTEDTVITITQADLLAGASDVDGDTLSAVNLSIDASFGALTDNGDGTWSFEPSADFNGTVPLSFAIDDGTVQTPATGNLNLAAVNDLPTLDTAISFTATEDQGLVINAADILANASDVDGDVLSVTNIASVDGNTTVINNNDGTFTLYGDDNFAGTDNLEITISDGTGTATFSSSVEVAGTADEPFLSLNLNTTPVHDFTVEEGGWIDPAIWGWSTDNTGSSGGAGFSGLVEVNSASAVYGVGGATEGNVLELEGFAGDAGNLWRELDIQAGETFTIEFDISGRNNLEPQSNHVKLFFEGQEIDQLIPEVGFTTVSYTLTATSDNPRFEFQSASNDGAGALLDRITVTKAELTGAEDTAIPIDLSASLADTDGSETLDVEISGLIADAVLSDGVNSFTATAETGSVDVTAWDLANLTVTPPANYSGDLSLTASATATDAGGDTATSTIDIPITVTAVNDAVQVGDNLTATIDEDGSFTLTQAELIANASDIDGDTLTASNLQAENASITDNGDGTFTVAPDANFNGDLAVTFDISDGQGSTVQSQVDVTVNAVNDAPVVANVVVVEQFEEEIVIVDPAELINLVPVSDVDGDTLTMTSMRYEGSDGTFVSNADGTYTITGNTDFVGIMPVIYTVEDGNGGSVEGTINVQIVNVNDLPVAGDPLSATMQEDGSYTFTSSDLLVNASDVDGNIISVSSVSLADASQGEITTNDDGSYTFAPSANFNGDVQINYSITDGVGAPVANTLNVTVEAVNDGPLVDVSSSTVAEDGTIIITQDDLLANASDLEGDALSATNLQLAAGSTEASIVDNGDGTFTVTPDANFNGSLNFTFDVSDGTDTVQATHVTTVEAVNDAADAGTVTPLTMAEDGALEIDPDYILGFASDVEGDSLSITSLSLRDQSQGTLTQNSQTGMYSFTPAANFAGAVALDYVINDGTDDTSGSMEVNVTPVNDAAFAEGNAHATVMEDGAITFNAEDLLDLFADVEGDAITISRVVTAEGEEAEGTVVDNGDGTFTFTPEADFAGTTQLQVVVSDGSVESAMALPVYVRPVADGAVITRSQDGPIIMNEDETGFLSLSVDLLDASESLTSLVMTGYPVGFTVSDGTHSVTITQEGQLILINDWDISNIAMDPPANWTGTFEVTVTATTVDYGDQGSYALPDSTDINGDFTATEGQDLILTEAELLDMAENTEAQAGDEIGLVHLMDRSQRSITDNGDGTWTFSPADGFTGEVDFAYVIQRNGELLDEQASIGVHPADPGSNNGPDVDGIATTDIARGNAVAFTDDDLLARISDADGDLLSISAVQVTDGGGVLEQAGDGTYTYTPDPDFVGEAKISFVASDGIDSVTSYVNVNVLNTAPEVSATPSAFTVDEDGAITFTEAELLTAVGATDAEDDTMSVEGLAVQPDSGTVINNGDGSWTVWPDPDFSGDMELTFLVNDGVDSTPASVPLNVQAVNDAPIESEPLAVEMDVNGTSTLTLEELLANVTDVDGDNLTVSNFQSANATVADNGDGTFSIISDADFQGTADITFDVSDGTDTIQASISANVSPAEDGMVEGNVADYTVAPGGSLSIAMPSSISSDGSVDHVIVSDLPAGASVTNGLEDADGNYVVSGDLSQPIQVTLGDGFEGDVSLNVTGYDTMDQPLASETIGVEVDDAYAMQGSSADGASTGTGTGETGGDWTTADNTNSGVDAMDDSSSFDSSNDNNVPVDDSNDMSGLG